MKIVKKIFVLVLALVATVASATYYLTKVYEYRPAPGQFINEIPDAMAGDTYEEVLQRAQEAICGYVEQNSWGNDTVYKPGMISLGGYGGYVVVGFDHPVVNVAGECDFQIFGNAYEGSSEPGIVMVSCDVNGNGVPDDPWYELAGSDYHSPKTQHGYTITYTKPANAKDPIAWTSNDVNADSLSGVQGRNTFHTQSYWPLWEEASTLSFTGTKLCNNFHLNGATYIQEARQWGYVDNKKDYDPYASDVLNDAMNPGFDIGWAVDASGNAVHLPVIHFIKVYNAMNQVCGWIGETSTEIQGGVDLHPDAKPSAVGDISGDGVVNVGDVTALVELILNSQTRSDADINGDGMVNVGDVTVLINLILTQ